MLAATLSLANALAAVRSFAKDHRAVLLVGAFAGVLLFTQLKQRELWPSHEARAAQESQQFLTTGSWGVHHLFDGSYDYQKPPLFYWLVAGAAWLRGGTVDAMAVRIPSAVAGWITILVVTLFLQRRRRSVAALLAGITLTTACHFVAISRTGRIDVPLTAAVTVAVLSLQDGRWFGAGIAIGLAVLLKGPIGLVMPVCVASCVKMCQPAATMRWNCIGKSLCLGCVIAAPWFIYVGIETHWEYWRVFFWHHNVARAAGTADDLARHPFWFYPARWMVDWLPWSPLLLLAMIDCVRRFIWRIDRELAFGVVWMLAITILLSVSRFKRADYLIPAYPAVAIVLGCWLERLFLTFNNSYRRWAQFGFAAMLLGTTIVYAMIESRAIPKELQRHPQHDFAEMLRSQAATDRPIVFFRVEDHLLAFHLKPPLISVNEWENLNVWIGRLGEGIVVMPHAEAHEWSKHVAGGTLQEVGRMTADADGRSPRTWIALRCRAHVVKTIHE